MGAAQDFLSKILPLANFIIGTGTIAIAGIWVLFGYKYNFYEWFGPLFMAFFGIILISSDLKLQSVRNLCKFLDYYLGRGIFYCQQEGLECVALTIIVAKYNYEETCAWYLSRYCTSDGGDCPNCKINNNTIEDIYQFLVFIGAYIVLGLGCFCIVLHFITTDKRIDSSSSPDEDNSAEISLEPSQSNA